MNHPGEPFVESDIPLFDVVVKMPSGMDLATVECLARDAADLSPEHIAGLIKALRNGPQVKVGAGVSQDRANKAKVQFSKAGLSVVIKPILTLQTKLEGAFDGLFVCPACQERVTLPTNRQCPACGVFVDKVTEEFLLKRKIMEQERAKLDFKAQRDAKESVKLSRRAMEAAIRAQVRKELEAEFGQSEKQSIFGGKTGALRAIGLTGMLALAVIGGNALPQSGWPFSKAENIPPTNAPADVDKMLDKIGPKSTGAADTASGTGDPDIDDLLVQQGGNRTGKGISLEQALAAANTLGKAVGNTTAERAWSGASGAAAPAPVSSANTTTETHQAHWMLAAEFARQLAELGQWQRAKDVIKTLKARPDLATAPAANATAVRVADLEVQAWAIAQLGESRARNAADQLKTDATAIADPAERAQALGRVGVILSHHAQLPPAASQAFLTLSAESLKLVKNANQRTAAVDDWMVSWGEVLLSEVTLHAKAGLWSKAKSASGQLDGLIKEASSGQVQARLYAIDYQIKQKLGQADKASQSLSKALSSVGKNAKLAQRAAQLRSVAQLTGDASLEPVQVAVNSLLGQLELQSGLDKAQALTQLALLQADAGLRAKSDQYSRLAQATTGVSPTDAAKINSDLLVRGDMAAAKVLHSQGLYAESEILLQRLAGYLF